MAGRGAEGGCAEGACVARAPRPVDHFLTARCVSSSCIMGKDGTGPNDIRVRKPLRFL